MKIGNLFKGDKVIWMVYFFLAAISVVEVFSASSFLTYQSGNYLGPITRHIVMLLGSLSVAVLLLNVPCRYFKIVTPILLTVSAILLLWVLFFGTKINDGSRWINFFGMKFQPSEIAKGTVVLVTAQILSAMQREDGADTDAFKFIMWVLVPMSLLIGLENLSTAALLCAVIFMMMVVGRVPWSQLGKLLGIVAIVGVIAVTAVWVLGSEDDKRQEEKQRTELAGGRPTVDKSTVGKFLHRAGTWKKRLVSFFEPDPAPEDYDLDANLQVAHANIAIESSGIIGKGPGNSTERDYLPQAFSDFIYAIVIEEMGITGAIVVLFLYITLLVRTARIAQRCENNFPAFLAMGLALLMVSQAFFNMLVAVGLAPVTGQPLPLISRGGTSTIINGAYIGIILSVSRTAKINKDFAKLKVVTAEKA